MVVLPWTFGLRAVLAGHLLSRLGLFNGVLLLLIESLAGKGEEVFFRRRLNDFYEAVMVTIIDAKVCFVSHLLEA